MNISLLCKWWWLLENEEGLWQEIVKLKYVRDSLVCMIQSRISDSPWWKDLMNIRPIYVAGRGYEMNNGKLISFWLDPWLDKEPNCRMYPILFDLAVNQCLSVHDVAMVEWVIQFKIRLPPIISEQWYRLAISLNCVVLNESKDKVVWKWTPCRKFTVKSVYLHLTKNEGGLSYKSI
jgi:hypothetical protein